jgi:hypothetical protein
VNRKFNGEDSTEPRRAGGYASTLTARAATTPTVAKETAASTMKSNFVLELSGIVSVGENAAALVKETNKKSMNLDVHFPSPYRAVRSSGETADPDRPRAPDLTCPARSGPGSKTTGEDHDVGEPNVENSMPAP